MRFRIWHLLTAMAFVALWLPTTRGLLALEAQDHLTKPQGAVDIAAFYAATATIVGTVIVGCRMVVAIRTKKRVDAA